MPTLSFDASAVEPQEARSFDLLPKGEYLAEVMDSTMKPTAKGGEYLELVVNILDGDYANRRIWDRLNLVNANETAADIARRALSALCHAVGVLQVTESEELHGIPFVVCIGVERGKNGYDDKNKVTGYKPAPGGSSFESAPRARPAAAPMAAKPAPAAAPAGKAPPPWAKKAAA